jgi:hypothetical protein
MLLDYFRTEFDRFLNKLAERWSYYRSARQVKNDGITRFSVYRKKGSFLVHLSVIAYLKIAIQLCNRPIHIWQLHHSINTMIRNGT